LLTFRSKLKHRSFPEIPDMRGEYTRIVDSAAVAIDVISVLIVFWTIAIVITIALVNLWIIFVVFNCLCRILAVIFNVVSTARWAVLSSVRSHSPELKN